MKNIFFAIIASSVFCNALSAQSPLEKLLYSKQFTLLNNALNKPAYSKLPEANIYRAIVLNAFGKPSASNALIISSLAGNPPLPDSVKFYLLQSQANNYISLGDYKNAYTKAAELLKNYPSFFNKEALEDEHQALKIWQQLIKTEPQQVLKTSDTKLPLKRDLAGLWNIPVKINDSTENFIFDSGAGISTISDSYANLLGLHIIDNSEVDVKSGITGIVNKSKLGIAAKLHIGNIVASNVVFLVFPDSALTFAGGAYKINGIIGFPVIKALGSCTISKNEIFIPLHDPVLNIEPNMSVDQLKPVIYLSYNNDVLPFTFDTGANASTFSNLFYNKYKAFVDKDGTEKKVPMGGAGGSKKFSMVEMPELILQHYNKNIILKKANVSKERLNADEDFYFGNLGQDVINKFEKMTVNFNESYILFE